MFNVYFAPGWGSVYLSVDQCRHLLENRTTTSIGCSRFARFNLDQTGLNAGRQQHRYYFGKALDSILSLHCNFITYVYDVIYNLFDRSTSSGRDRKFVCDRFWGS